MIKQEHIDKINQWSEKYKDNRFCKHWDKFLRLNPDIDLYVSELIKNEPWFSRKITAITLLSKGICDVKKCIVCGKTLDVNKAIKGKKYCSRKCSAESDERKKKNKQTCLERYGVDNGAKSTSSKEKVKQTCLKKYGVENHNKSYSVREKIKKTCLERFGSSTPAGNSNIVEKMKTTKLKNHGTLNSWDCKEIRDKTIATNRERYGTDHASQSKEFRENVKNTCLNKYGVECSLMSEEAQKKTKNTLVLRYGVDNPLKNEEIKDKLCKTNMKKYGVKYSIQNEDIKRKMQETCLENFGTTSPMKAEIIKKKAKRKQLSSSFLKRISIWKDCVIPLFDESHYEGSEFTYRWKCVKCGNEFEQHIHTSTHIGGIRNCPRCLVCYPYTQGFSYMEIEVFDFIKSVYNGNIISNSRKIISPYEIDLYFSEKRLAIEFDGLFWHSDASGTDSGYHLLKTEQCELLGIHLVHIFENEWLINQKIVKDRIRSILGIGQRRIFARKCSIQEISSFESEEFLDANHLHGSCHDAVRYGLYHDGELVSVMTFGKPRFNKNYDYELLRFASKIGCNVVGGAGKLLAEFRKSYRGSIISYADRRYSMGNLYEKLGFVKSGISKPNYVWTKRGNALTRYQCQKHRLAKVLGDGFDATKTEVENMEHNGWIRVFDCGNIVYAMN